MFEVSCARGSLLDLPWRRLTVFDNFSHTVCRKLSWTIDMKGIAEMYESYESLSYWPFLSAPTQGIKVDFVRAENSSYVWPMDDVERLKAYGHRVHHLPQAGKGAYVRRQR